VRSGYNARDDRARLGASRNDPYSSPGGVDDVRRGMSHADAAFARQPVCKSWVVRDGAPYCLGCRWWPAEQRKAGADRGGRSGSGRPGGVCGECRDVRGVPGAVTATTGEYSRDYACGHQQDDCQEPPASPALFAVPRLFKQAGKASPCEPWRGLIVRFYSSH
jgi:hypothetical protein